MRMPPRAAIERSAWSSRRSSSDLDLALQELCEDLLPDLAGAGADPDDVAAAMIGTGLGVARRHLDRGDLDAAAADVCTRLRIVGLAGGERARRRTA